MNTRRLEETRSKRVARRLPGRGWCAVALLTVASLSLYPSAALAQETGRSAAASAGKLSQDAAPNPAAESHNPGIETLVLIRHGEKPARGLGLLTCQGLNRALRLPDFFGANFGRPNQIFAPNPSVKATELHGDRRRYDYVRPLLTIGPTAIRFGVPINVQLPYNAPGLLADTLLDAKYHSDTIFIVWEHVAAAEFADIVLRRFHEPTAVAPWPNNDFDTYYLFRIDWRKDVPTLKFEVRAENLGPISEKCPEAAKP